MVLDRKDITKIYKRLKKRSERAFMKGSYDKCLKYINLSARVAYQFSWIFKDDELELSLNELSKALLKPVENYSVDESKYVFYDSFSYDNRGLTQQYIRGLMNMDVNFLYITESSYSNDFSHQIFFELKLYDKAKVISIPTELEDKGKIEFIYRQILSYKPSKLLMHLSPYAVSPLVAFYALPKEIIKYQINLTDHAFWLGVGCLDFIFEFRPYGCAISQYQRDINKEKILLLPYYPIVNEIEFQGFPKQCEDKLIIFSGGAYPKIIGENNFFLNLVKNILLSNTEVIFLFAGSGNAEPIKKYISENDLENRLILLGHRFDINEVFKHCDIYMSTYPIGGGLMVQMAAINAKPIISFSTFDKAGTWPEETLCQFKKISITFTSMEKFLVEVNKLITNKDYRISVGKILQDCVITFEKFNQSFINTINNNATQFHFDTVDINVELMCEHNIDFENSNNEFKIHLLKSIKLETLFLSTKIFFWALTYVFTKSFRLKIYRRL